MNLHSTLRIEVDLGEIDICYFGAEDWCGGLFWLDEEEGRSGVWSGVYWEFCGTWEGEKKGRGCLGLLLVGGAEEYSMGVFLVFMFFDRALLTSVCYSKGVLVV